MKRCGASLRTIKAERDIEIINRQLRHRENIPGEMLVVTSEKVRYPGGTCNWL